MDIVYKKIGEIKPYDKNPRRNDQAVEAVKNSIQEFGWQQPLVIDKNNIVVIGHTRLKAAKELHMTSVPCLIAENLTDEQIRALRLADNKVGELAEWDDFLLKGELNDIFDIDMEDFGFDLDFDEEEEEEPQEKPNERERTFDYYNLEYINLNRCVGKYQMPYIRATDFVPTDLMSFNYMLNTDSFEKGIHFYVDDYQFERMWSDPQKYLERISNFTCCLTPDFSMYTEMPLAMMVWNKFRSQLIGQIMQDYGITVIPTLQWCREDSFEFCFDGIEPGGTVSVSTIGVKKEDAASEIWFKGMDEAIKKLKPSHIVVYGGDIGYKFDCPVTYIDNHNTERMKGDNKGSN